ncbi:MAG: four helix bundle protein [Gelidibacter sp.]
MNNYKELIVWQKAMDLVEQVYALTLRFPKEEKYGLISQIQRSAVSIPSNISEGAGRNSNKEFKNFLGIANGSINELSTQLELSIRIGYLEKDELKEVFYLISEIQRMNFTLIKKFSNE